MESNDLPSTSDSTNQHEESPEHGPITLQIVSEDIEMTSIEGTPSTPTRNLENGPIDGWTKEEKFQLYLGIKYKGSKCLKQIGENIPTKTLEQIEAAISHYKERANETPECTNKKLKVKKSKMRPLIPLANWAKLLTDNLSYDKLQTEMVSALRLIADLDNIPPVEFTDNVDFRQVYHQIADAMEGKSVHDTQYTKEVLNSCIFEAALISKSFITTGTLKTILGSVRIHEEQLAFPFTKDCDHSIVRHLASQQNYNPLGIPVDYLTPVPDKLTN